MDPHRRARRHGRRATARGSLAGAQFLNIECQQRCIDFRLRTRYVDEQATDLDDALARIAKYTKAGEAKSIALLGNAAEILPELVTRGVKPDAVTDQTSAHDPGARLSADRLERRTVARTSRKRIPTRCATRPRNRCACMSRRCSLSTQQGIPTFDYGNNIRQMAKDEGCTNAFDFPGFVPAYVRPLFCRGIGPFRWVALSGDPEDIYKTDAKVKELIPDDTHLHSWLDMARERISFQGLPARICWVGLGQRHKLGLAFNEMVRNGELKAPVVIGRDHLDSGSVASPNRETESMQDGSDAVSDWPLAQRDAQRRRRRDLGITAPRRRRRHGLLAALRRRHRLRWHRSRRQAHCARAVERSRHRRHAPCGCGLRDREGLREGAGAEVADGLTTVQG